VPAEFAVDLEDELDFVLFEGVRIRLGPLSLENVFAVSQVFPELVRDMRSNRGEQAKENRKPPRLRFRHRHLPMGRSLSSHSDLG